MKKFQKMIWAVLACNILLLCFVGMTFHVDDMTLGRGNMFTFNEGWVITWADGSKEEISSLPYSANCGANEKVILENTIPQHFAGMSMNFLSADKRFNVYIDDKLVYAFGMNDKRAFGHTPGSMENFIDIPHQLESGKIRIEMDSPYKNYAANIGEILVANRDVAILHMLRANMVNVGVSMLILTAGVGFWLMGTLSWFSRKKQKTGLLYLSVFCIDASLYYFIETKLMSIFYGNQTLYSYMIFVCLMLMPFLLILYYERRLPECNCKALMVLLYLICGNIIIQFLLQITNIMDFMKMAFLSHLMIFITIIFVITAFVKKAITERKADCLTECLAIVCMGTGGIIDMLRTYTIKVGDLGKFSRFGTAIFCLLLVAVHLRELAGGYASSLRENARLLKEQVVSVEKQNAQLRLAKEEAEAAKTEAQAANVAKGEFLARMSHEIRTPINAVLGMDEMILRESTEPAIKEYAQDINSAGHTLLSLINDILDFSKIDSGKMEIIPVEYDLSSLIHDLINMMSPKAASKRLKLNTSVDSKLPSKMLGDDVRIRQILMNIMSNAVKYTHEGHIDFSVTGRKEAGKVILHFEVKDTGIGIKKEDLPKLFEAFQRVDEKRNRAVEGTGLGMSITVQLLDLMGSKLEVESEYGKGSNFYFDLVQPIVDETEIGDFEKRIQRNVDYKYEAKLYAPKAQLLVVDDNAINRRVFKHLLKQTGVQITEAVSGFEAINLVKEKHFDLIFLDHMMPDMDGIETLHKMQEMKDNLCKDTPIVILTANAVTGAKEMYIKEGFNDFISKPIVSEKLELLIANWISDDLLEEKDA